MMHSPPFFPASSIMKFDLQSFHTCLLSYDFPHNSSRESRQPVYPTFYGPRIMDSATLPSVSLSPSFASMSDRAVPRQANLCNTPLIMRIYRCKFLPVDFRDASKPEELNQASPTSCLQRFPPSHSSCGGIRKEASCLLDRV